MREAFIGGEHLLHRWGTPSSSVGNAFLIGGQEIPSLNYLIIIVIEAEWEAYSGA